MTAVAGLVGQIRGIRPLRRKNSNETFGREISVLTEIAGHLGETQRVTIFNSSDDLGELTPGQSVALVVQIKAGQYGVEATYLGQLEQRTSLESTLDFYESSPAA